MDNRRAEYILKIKAANEQLKTAGVIHRRDLVKHIERMEKELHIYDQFQLKRKNESC